jgi:hypothetical protein
MGSRLLLYNYCINASKPIDQLKDTIEIKKAPEFDDISTGKLALWRVSIPLVPKKNCKDISLGDVLSKEELDETDHLSVVFPDKPPKR